MFVVESDFLLNLMLLVVFRPFFAKYFETKYFGDILLFDRIRLQVLESLVDIKIVLQVEHVGKNNQNRLHPHPDISSLECTRLHILDSISTSNIELTLTRDVRNSSLIPTGSTLCRSQSTRGHAPNPLKRNFSRIIANPNINQNSGTLIRYDRMISILF